MKRSTTNQPWFSRRWAILCAVSFLAVCWSLSRRDSFLPAAPLGDQKGKGPVSPSSAEPTGVEVRFRDNSLIKLVLQTETILLATPYGRLTIPVGEVCKIEFATRVPDAILKRVEESIRTLGSKEFKQRERAAAELVKIGVAEHCPEGTLPALKSALESDDAEVKRAAEELIASIKEGVPEEMLTVRPHDVVHTKDARLTGKIETNIFRATSVPFGEVQVKLADMRRLRALSYVEPEADTDARAGAIFLPPGGLQTFANQLGTKLVINVTGRNNAAVWGTGIYTINSDLGAAAVHAGVLKVGQTGVVRVQIVPAPPAFVASLRNGINSQPWTGGGAYQIQIPKPRKP